ncbi:MAG: beta-ketoacyl synthase N-terminal-like domain-containing protein [Cyanobacteria bacterium P01_F01_bin.150]
MSTATPQLSHSSTPLTGLEIAIVGMAGRFPQARTLDEFWQNLQQGVESVRFYSDEELRSLGVDEATLNQPNFVKAGALLEDIDQFDAEFFGYSPREAEVLDPQQRLFLEVAWEALEHAGYDAEQYEGAIAVYAGAAMNGYLLNLYRNAQTRSTVSPYQIFLSSDKDFLTTRASYKLNLTGPSVDVQTACSTSLVAVHMACQSLLSGECDMALTGGVAAAQQVGYVYQPGGIYSPDGHCRAFDAEAQGTVPGKGLGLVVLKRLEDAQADQDTIYAVIKGSAINNDGDSKVSYTAPSVEAQAQVIRTAQTVAEVDPSSITYVETHGTGTPLGDPIEVAALTQAFQRDGENKSENGYCALGSVKSNLGHLDTAAGIASLLKTILSLTHRQIPPSLHFQQPNPQLQLDSSPFRINHTLQDWQVNGTPRRAGVSSFGIGGTNAHVILEEALESKEQPSPSRPWQLLILSAKTETALEAQTQRLIDYLQQCKDPGDPDPRVLKEPWDLNLANSSSQALADIAYTLQKGRRGFDYRRTILCQTVEDAIATLTADKPVSISENPALTKVLTGNSSNDGTSTPQTHRPIVFMFPGQGSQYENMGRELYDTESVFRQWVDRCCEGFNQYLYIDLKALIYPDNERQKAEEPTPSPSQEGDRTSPTSQLPPKSKIQNLKSKITETQYAQPALFTIEYALAQLWISWGIKPDVVIGHSIGEYVAGAIANVFTFDDALKIVAKRGQLMQAQPTGSMVAVSVAADEIEAYLTDGLNLAAVNAPKLCVVSGSEKAIAKLQTRLEKDNISHRLLHTSHAFHSHLMEDAVQPFTDVIKGVALQAPTIPLLSNITGTLLSDEDATNPSFWGQQLRSPVRFADGINLLQQDVSHLFLEVGPSRTLTTFVQSQKVEGVQKAEGRRQKAEEPTPNSSQEGDRSGATPQLPNSPTPQLPNSPILTSLRHPKEKQSDIFHLMRTLGQLWLEGVSVNWDGFYKNERRSRVPLPTYPFERQRYWIEPDESLLPGSTSQDTGAVTATMQQSQVKIQADSADWLYSPSWQRVSPRSVPGQVDRQIWLVVTNSADSSDLGIQLGQRIQGLGHEVVTVIPGREPFDQVEYRTFSVNPESPDGYRELLDDLELRELLPNRILYLWHGMEDWFGFYGLRSLPQALTAFLKQQPVQITVVTENVHDVTGTESLNPNQASLLGLCQVIPQEYPTLGCNCIDLDRDKYSDAMLQTLAQELIQPPVDALVAYRGRHRWQQIYTSIKVDDQVQPAIALRPQGHYLVVGQMEQGLGEAIAPFLIESLDAKLSIICPGTTPPHPSLRPTDTLRENQGEGAEPPVSPFTKGGLRGVFIETNITDLQQMQEAITQAEAKHGEIHGVFYSTPMSNEQSMSLLQQRDKASWEYSLRTKIYGLEVLTQVLAERRPDFCLLQSSLSSIVGGLGLGTYSSANHVIDAIAHDQSASQSVPWISVNWDGFHSMDNATLAESVGDQAELQSKMSGRLEQQLAPFTLTAEEVWKATQRVLALGNTAQVVVSKGDLDARLRQWIRVQPEGLIAKDTAPPGTLKKQSQHQRPQLSAAYMAPRTEMEGAIATIWQELLGIEQVGIEDSFFELGGHSLLAIQAIARLREQFGVELPMQSLLFEAPTIAGIAQLVETQMATDNEGADNDEGGEDAEDMAALLAEIQALSPDEVAAELGEK